MTVTILTADGHQKMPWKNGRGVTTQIAIHPQDVGMADFGWRISMASVTEDGDFSIFPGIERTLAVLEGDGIALSVAGAAPELLSPDGAPLSFAADVPVTATLPGEAITDLNVMTRRGAFRHTVLRSSNQEGGDADWQILLATAPTMIRLDGQSVRLQPLDALLCDGPEARLAVAADLPLWVIRIWEAQDCGPGGRKV